MQKVCAYYCFINNIRKQKENYVYGGGASNPSYINIHIYRYIHNTLFKCGVLYLVIKSKQINPSMHNIHQSTLCIFDHVRASFKYAYFGKSICNIILVYETYKVNLYPPSKL